MMGTVELFGTILIALVVLAIVAACLSYIGAGRLHSSIGRSGDLTIDGPRGHPTRRSGVAINAEMNAEIRQMLEAKSARRERRGEPPLDIDAELAELMSPASLSDVDLREEVRQLIVARNARRVRQGEKPLQVEAEIDRQLRELGS